MARLSELIVKITSDTAGFTAGVREVSAQLQRLDAVSSGAVRGLNAVFERMSGLGARLSIGISAPLAAVGLAAAKADADLDALRKGLIAVSGSAGAADRQLARLAEVAKLPGLGFREAIQGSVNLQAAGFSAQLAERSLRAFGNALAAVGKGKADMDGVILALAQISAKGKIAAQEINQLSERLPQIRQAMKAAFGTADTEAIQKMGLSSQEFVERIVAEFEKLPPVTGGVKNQFENIRDAMDRAMAEIGAALRPGTELVLRFGEAAVQRATEAAQAFRRLPPEIQATAIALGALAAAAGPALAALGQIGLGLSGIASAIPVIKAAGAAASVAILSFGQFAGLLVSQVVPAAASASIALKALGGAALITATALAAVEAASGVARLASAWRQYGDAQRQAQEASDQQRRGIETLRIALHQHRISTEQLDQAYRRGEISLSDYVRGLARMAAAHRGAAQSQQEAQRSIMDLAEAFRVLGIDSTEQLAKRYRQAREALAAVEQAYREGRASAMDLARAQEAARQASEEARPSAGAADARAGGARLGDRTPENGSHEGRRQAPSRVGGDPQLEGIRAGSVPLVCGPQRRGGGEVWARCRDRWPLLQPDVGRDRQR